MGSTSAGFRHVLAWTSRSGLTEATLAGLEFLIRRRSYQPWGLVFDRQSIYDAGGGPVWYARPDEYGQLRQSMQLRSWAVRLEPGSSDWLEEREWRVPLSYADHPHGLPLFTVRLVALLVGSQDWRPIRPAVFPSPVTGQPEWQPALPPTVARVPLWWWNQNTSTLYSSPPLLL